jgi:hypothetical protein
MKRLIRALFLVAMSMLLASCAVWTRLDSARLNGPDGLSVQPPAGWMRFNLAGDRVIDLTRDGRPIQILRIEYRKSDQAFPAIKKKSTPDMLPSEAADLMLADLKADPSLANIQIVENQPYRVAGKPGFWLHGRYRDGRGAPFDLVAVGRPTQGGLLVVFYRALSVYYYPRDLKTFEQTVASIELAQK